MPRLNCGFLVFVLCAYVFVVLAPVSAAQAQSGELTKSYLQHVVLKRAGQYRKAELHLKRAMKLGETEFGRDHKTYAGLLNDLAGLYKLQGRYAQARLTYDRSLKIKEKVLGLNHPKIAITLINFAGLNQAQGRYSEAEALYRRALNILKKTLGSAHPTTATLLNNLALLYKAQGRYGEAGKFFRTSLKMREKMYGADHFSVGQSLNNLALLYQAQGRDKASEPFYRRSLEVLKKARGVDHPDVGLSHNNLAGLYRVLGRYKEAEIHYRRSLKILVKALGRDHPSVANSLSNLASLYENQRRYGAARSLYRRSLKIVKKSLGRNHPSVSTILNNMALTYWQQGEYGRADILYGHSLRIVRKALGDHHPDVAQSFNSLAELYFAQGKWQMASDQRRQAIQVLTHRSLHARQIGRGVSSKKASEVERNARTFWGLVKSVFRQDMKAGHADETFQSAQWAIGSKAAGALAQMSARKAAGSGELAKVVRERQDRVRQWQQKEKRLNQLRGVGKSDEKLEVQMVAIDKRIGEIDERLTASFPDYAALASPRPLSIEQVQNLLKADEALVLMLDTPKIQPTIAETFVWVLTREATSWHRARVGGAALADIVTKLRCGLDGSNWGDPSGWPDADPTDKQAKAAQQARRDKCIRLIGKTYSEQDWPPFDFATAFELYKKLFGPVEDVIRGKKLLVVSSGALTSLPLQVMVTQKTKSNGPTDVKAYKNAAWLINSHALTTLPSVASLQALRGIAKQGEQAKNTLIGFADPVFSVPTAKPLNLASTNLASSSRAARKHRHKRSVQRSYAAFFKGRNADLSTLAQSLPQLDGTRRELLEVGRVLNVPTKDLLLGRAASERAVKAAKLDQYRIVYFATHGLIAGDVKGLGEPALAFSLPAKASQLDDGLLTASEVTALKLNADWLVMSACNTAAGDKPGAEALSGLARAFFYAGAKTLLVSHWPVGDEAAVALTTHAFNNMDQYPGLGRSQALRHSMLAMIKKDTLRNVHPTSWAPFVVVGEGAGTSH